MTQARDRIRWLKKAAALARLMNRPELAKQLEERAARIRGK